MHLYVLGAGNAGNITHSNASVAVESADGEPLLLIDCGFDAPRRYEDRYDRLPDALYITHIHLDHVGGLESLATRILVEGRPPVRLYLPCTLVPWLHRRIASYPNWLAEGGANFWDAFQLIPVDETFWHAQWRFRATPARHHQPDTAFGLCLPGWFLYTGDTRPIPEVVSTYASHGEVILHDCALLGNPSHTGLADLRREYRSEHIERMWLYHVESEQAARRLEAEGMRVLRPGMHLSLARDREIANVTDRRPRALAVS